MMQLVGILIMLAAGLTWVLGGNSVRKQCLRRLGRPSRPSLIFDRFRSEFPYRDFTKHEKRKLLWFLLLALVLGLIGSGMASALPASAVMLPA